MNRKPREILDSGLRLKNGQSVRRTDRPLSLERFENVGVNIGTEATEKDGPVHESL